MLACDIISNQKCSAWLVVTVAGRSVEGKTQLTFQRQLINCI